MTNGPDGNEMKDRVMLGICLKKKIGLLLLLLLSTEYDAIDVDGRARGFGCRYLLFWESGWVL